MTTIVDAGTAERDWRTWGPLWSRPDLDLTGAGTPLVVAPHPDDAVLGAGGLLSLIGRAEMVAVTDGEPDPPATEAARPGAEAGTGTAAAPRSRETRSRVTRSLAERDLARGSLKTRSLETRSLETERALRALWLNGTVVHRLGQPYGRIDEDALENALIPLLWPGRWCLTTWLGDGDPDHEAAGRAAAVACAATGARLLDYPIWTWEWARPADPRVPWERAVRVGLPLSVRRAKITAIAAFESRVRLAAPDRPGPATLPPDVLASFLRPFEVFLA